MYIVTIDQDSPEYLEHFGVLGMHWGVRNSETQRKYNGGQEHNEARTDIVKPTKGHTYQGQFKPFVSKNQAKMLKRAAAGVAIGAGLAAGVAVGTKTGALKAVAKYGAKKLAGSKQLQQKGQEFAKRVRTNAIKSVKTQEGRNKLRQNVKKRKADISKAGDRKTLPTRSAIKRANVSGKVRAQAKRLKTKAWNSDRMRPIRNANDKFDYYTSNPVGRKKASSRLTGATTVGAIVSAPLIEGYSMDKHELRRKNGRHASTKWMRNKERLGS